jgi:intein/homing endonuclease
MSKNAVTPSSNSAKEARQEIVKLYLSGKSIGRIEDEMGVPHETARLILHKSGVRLRHVHAILHEPKSGLDYEIALLLGLHAGDGHLSDSWGISIGGDDSQMVEDVVSLAKSVLGIEPYIEVRRNHYLIVKSSKEQARAYFKRFGFTRGRKAGIVQVPEEIMRSENPEVWVGFLKGAFSSDGSFWFKGNSGQCRFEVSSLRFRDGFIDLARRLGFEFRAYSYVHHGGHNKLPLNLAYLGAKDEVARWMERVGSISDTHLRRYRQWRLKIGLPVAGDSSRNAFDRCPRQN